IDPAEWFLRPEVRNRLVKVDEVIWDRGSTHNHDRSLLWPTTERLYVFYRWGDSYRFQNHAGLPQRSDVWRINRAQSNGHNAPFPLELAEAVILAWSKPGDLVCDPYLGSGTTALAARKLERRFVGAEILPKYHQLARSARVTGRNGCAHCGEQFT